MTLLSKNFVKVLEMEGGIKKSPTHLPDSCRKSLGAGKPGQWKTSLIRAVITACRQRSWQRD